MDFQKNLDISVENNNHSQLLPQSNFQKDSLFDQTNQNLNINDCNQQKDLGFWTNHNPKERNGKQQNANAELQKRITSEIFKSKEKNDLDESNYSYNIQQNSFFFEIKEQGCCKQLEGYNKENLNQKNAKQVRQIIEKGFFKIQNDNSIIKRDKKLNQSFKNIPLTSQKCEEIITKTKIQPSKIAQIKYNKIKSFFKIKSQTDF
ncbi:ABC transporter family protein (macronuclear) [Tetrahymena thermophila SB210]|uniref:ABC transporter family protein n=1 Tax=Tetrahymena thermophila (strain SB210) TaxID=312017 RepID=W7XH63_TETTS|nr:ABC transporter family protein [Tetrahymena thermophila SB210]EWS73671.1 ABC transporter family protein [Tetrahymena thermophila SB210]|eukprot:XP_012653801.1 ABC transporter family protein [Tetrahymena thermophila SB210]